MNTVEPVVSVVVATHERAALLSRVVHAVEQQRDVGPVELVVVDDASRDETWTRLQQLAQESRVAMQVYRLPRNAGPATARNVGWRAAKAPVVAFTDDDCVPHAEWLAGLLAGIAAGADVVQGRTRPDPEQAARHGPFSRTLDVDAEDGFYQTCNIAYRRDLLEQLGGFDERFRHPTGEDTDLAWRARDAGAATAFTTDAVVFHDVRPSSIRTHLRDTWRWEGVVLTVREHPALRDRFHRRWFWKPSHPKAIAAAAGLVVALGPRRSPGTRVAGVAAAIPYVRYRARVAPLRGGPRRRLAVIPLALAADLAEVAVLAVASARYRCLLL